MLYQDSPVMKDNPWEDLYGHTCQWFHDKKDHFPGVCQHPEAKVRGRMLVDVYVCLRNVLSAVWWFRFWI